MIYILLTLVFFTITIMLNTVAARHAHPAIVAIVTSLVGGFVPLMYILTTNIKQNSGNQKFGIIMSVLCGLAVGLYVMALSKSFSENKVALVVPVVYGGAILLTGVLSYFIFKEKIALIEGFGLVFVLIGLSILIYAKATTA